MLYMPGPLQLDREPRNKIITFRVHSEGSFLKGSICST